MAKSVQQAPNPQQTNQSQPQTTRRLSLPHQITNPIPSRLTYTHLFPHPPLTSFPPPFSIPPTTLFPPTRTFIPPCAIHLNPPHGIRSLKRYKRRIVSRGNDISPKVERNVTKRVYPVIDLSGKGISVVPEFIRGVDEVLDLNLARNGML